MVSSTTHLELFSAVSPLVTPLFTPFYELRYDGFSVFLSKESLFVAVVLHVSLKFSSHATGNMSWMLYDHHIAPLVLTFLIVRVFLLSGEAVIFWIFVLTNDNTPV